MTLITEDEVFNYQEWSPLVNNARRENIEKLHKVLANDENYKVIRDAITRFECIPDDFIPPDGIEWILPDDM
jgi:hypothetical protein